MVSSLTQEGAETTLEGLAVGAFDYMPKQLSYVSFDIVKIRDDLIAKIKAAAETGRRRPMVRVTRAPVVPVQTHPHGTARVPPSVVTLGTSTGGPKGYASHQARRRPDGRAGRSQLHGVRLPRSCAESGVLAACRIANPDARANSASYPLSAARLPICSGPGVPSSSRTCLTFCIRDSPENGFAK